MENKKQSLIQGFKSYLDTVLVEQRNTADVALPVFDNIIATIGSLNGSSAFLTGNLDEVRIWSVALDSAEIMTNMHRVVGEDSPNLLAAWSFDEGQGAKVFDITDASYDGEIVGASWSDENPDIHNSSFTDTDGNYSIGGIYYDPSGTTFIVTPAKPYHVFQPANRQVTLSTSATTADGQNFQDNSQIEVSGYINFLNTNCYVESVEIKEKIENDDGTIDTVSIIPPVFTDNDGHYVCEFEPGSSHHIIPILGGHSFTNGFYETGVLSIPQGDVNFVDNRTYTLRGNVTGGDCEFPLGENFDVTISNSPCYSETFTTYNNGGFLFTGLPALHFEVVVIDSSGTYDFSGQQANLVAGDDTVKFTHRDSLRVELLELPNGLGAYPHVVEQGKIDLIYLTAYEQYGDDKCYTDTFHAQVTDNISDQNYNTDVHLDSTNRISVKYTPKWPNFLDGGQHPYQNDFQVTITDASGRQASAEFWALTEGVKSNPESRNSDPKSNLAIPAASSSPTVLTNKPTAPAINPFTNFLPARLAVIVRAKITNMK